MKSAFLAPVLFILSAVSLGAFSMAGNGENLPAVHSLDGGRYYLRTIPDDDFGTAGKTRIFEVKKDGNDELLQTIDVFMRGKVFVQWVHPGEWAIVHLEPERIRSANDFDKLGNVSRLVFYRAGKKIKTYDQAELAEMGLRKHQARLTGGGSFTVEGILQFSGASNFKFQITQTNPKTQKREWHRFDLKTGEVAEIVPVVD